VGQLQNMGDYPDDLYSRYVAGLCFELYGDSANAVVQYRIASKLSEDITIDSKTGKISPSTGKKADSGDDDSVTELVCLVDIGRSPSGYEVVNGIFLSDRQPYAEIYDGKKYLGRSYNLSTIASLVGDTMDQEAAANALKTGARIALKVWAAHELGQENAFLGDLVTVLLFALEQPDVRRWESLPNWMQVARVECPSDLDSYKVVFKNARGEVYKTVKVKEPIHTKGNVKVSFCRDITRRSKPKPIEQPEKVAAPANP